MKLAKTSPGERSLAVFIDFENLALGFKDRHDRFQISLVLKRLLEKGKIVAKKAYCAWSRFASYTAHLHEAAIELVEIPKRGQTGKNSADIRLCVDAMDLAYSKEHIDTFVIVSGDSDFSPLVSKLKELGKHVIGLGMANSTSNLLRDNCDEFIYYEDLSQSISYDAVLRTDLADMKKKGFMLLLNALAALRRENKETLWSSMVKDTMKRMRPSFNETYHGYKSFSEMLEDAQKESLLTIEVDKKSGSYIVLSFISEPQNLTPPLHQQTVARQLGSPTIGISGSDPAAVEPPKRRSRGGRGRGKGRSSTKVENAIPAENVTTGENVGSGEKES